MSEITDDDIDDVTWTIGHSCSFCDETFEGEVDKYAYDSMEDGAVSVLNEAGWGIGENDEQVGVACPECLVKLIED